MRQFLRRMKKQIQIHNFKASCPLSQFSAKLMLEICKTVFQLQHNKRLLFVTLIKILAKSFYLLKDNRCSSYSLFISISRTETNNITQHGDNNHHLRNKIRIKCWVQIIQLISQLLFHVKFTHCAIFKLNITPTIMCLRKYEIFINNNISH